MQSFLSVLSKVKKTLSNRIHLQGNVPYIGLVLADIGKQSRILNRVFTPVTHGTLVSEMRKLNVPLLTFFNSCRIASICRRSRTAFYLSDNERTYFTENNREARFLHIR